MKERFYLLYCDDSILRFNDFHEIHVYIVKNDVRNGFVEYVESCCNILKVILRYELVDLGDTVFLKLVID